MPRSVALIAAVALVVAVPFTAAASTRYDVDATYDSAARAVTGTVEIRLTNVSAATLDDVLLVLYPNRFRPPEPGLNDVSRPYVQPHEEHVPGGIDVSALEQGERDHAAPIADATLETIDGWPDTALRARLPRPLASGASTLLRMRFRTVLPERYGVFGASYGNAAAVAGWYPLLAARDAHGAWTVLPDLGPADVEGVLHTDATQTVAVGARVASAADADADERTGAIRDVPFVARGGGRPSLLASPRYRRHERVVDAATIVYLELPQRWRGMFPPWKRPHAEVMLDALERIVQARPAALARPSSPLVVVEAPLRLELTAPSGDGVAIVSDRILRVDPLLRDFHERALAAAVYGAMLRPAVAARERPEDVAWITEGVADALADRYLVNARPRARTVYDWIGLFNVFAIVDRFETAPKIPFARAFFRESRHADELRDGLESFARDRPFGGTIVRKLRNEVGDEVYASTLDAYVAGTASLRTVATARAGRPLDWLFDEWTTPYPDPLNYAIGVDTRLNVDRAAGDVRPATRAEVGGGAPNERARYEHHVVVERQSSRPIREPVDVDVEGGDDRRVHLVWNDAERRAEFVVTTPWRARRVTLDPQRRLLEDTRADDTRPQPLQLVLDSADVTITSSEFGLSGLFVARRRYDYRKDVGMIAFYSDRAFGFTVGPRVHFGAPNDPTSYRHNIYGFYTFASLRESFHDKSNPDFRTDGELGGIGLRYDYTDEFTYDNPGNTTKVRAFADLYHHGLGSSFDYADWGIRASAVRPVLSPRTLAAAQLMTAFSSPIGGDVVPNQGRYSLGGDLAVRGISVERRLGENLVLGRFELRQTVYPELDLSLADVLVLRRGQLRLFVDTGNVDDRRATLYNVSDFAVGVGVGLAAFYDFLGFYPAVAYIAVAQRVDQGLDGHVQFLFGTRQAF